MKKNDYHIHGDFSADSVITYEELIEKAISLKYNQIAFSDHFDYLTCDVIVYGLPAYHNYKKHLSALKTKYSSDIEIFIGAEIGECHRVKEYVDTMIDYRRPDIITGSIHNLSDNFNVSIPFSEELTKKQVINYYEENLELVETAPIDILGHLGIHKRYYTQEPDERFVTTIVDQILKTVIKRNIALEVNYSPYRKPYNRCLPEMNIVTRYTELGGSLITLGSDSHSLSDFGDNFEKAVAALKGAGCKTIAHREKSTWACVTLE